MLKRYTLPEMQDLWGPEERQFEGWLQMELAVIYARMMLGEITPEVYENFKNHCKINVARIKEIEAEVDHDMIAFVKQVQESLVAAGVGEYKEELHKRVTSYNIEDPALVLRLRKAIGLILDALHKLEAALYEKAHEHKWTLMMARTHGQYAEPSTFGLLCMVFREAILRSIRRLEFVQAYELFEGNISGAVGAFGGIDPEIEAIALAHVGLRPAVAETQILQRDRHAMMMCVLAIAGASIEQACRTFWEMMRSDSRELQEPRKSKQRGSSAMAAKRNPILTERGMGLPRLLRGHAMIAIENIATPEWRAIEQSSVERHIFPDSTALIHYLATKMAGMVEKLVVFPERMLDTLQDRSQGVWAGQQIRNALMEKGIDYDTAYEYIQAVSFEAVDSQVHLRDLLGERPISNSDWRTAVEIVGQEIVDKSFDARAYIERGVEHIFTKASQPEEEKKP